MVDTALDAWPGRNVVAIDDKRGKTTLIDLIVGLYVFVFGTASRLPIHIHPTAN